MCPEDCDADSHCYRSGREVRFLLVRAFSSAKGVDAHPAFQPLGDILKPMLPRTSKIVATLVLLICFLCPILELFDHWDHTAETGNDTEYTFVIVALCMGVAYAFARLVFTSPTVKGVSDIILHFSAQKPLSPGARSSYFIVPIPLSPPNPALRI